MKDSNIMIMYDNVRKCVVSTIKKVSERCPLQSAVARNAVIFSSEILLENTERNLQKKFKSLSQHLVSLWIVSSHKAGVDLSKISRLNDIYFKELKVAKYPKFC